MGNTKKFLQDILGSEGYDRLFSILSKSLPSEAAASRMVVPRALLSWANQNIAPLKIGESKTLSFPGRSDVSIHIIKQSDNMYKGAFIKDGKAIHVFADQYLPGYDETEKSEGKLTVLKALIKYGLEDAKNADYDAIEKASKMAPSVMSEIGHVIDTLVHNHIARQSVIDALEKIEEKKLPDPHNEPEPKENKDMKEGDHADKVVPQSEVDRQASVAKDVFKVNEDRGKPETKVVPSGKEAASADIKPAKPLTKEDMPMRKPKKSLRSLIMKPMQAAIDGFAQMGAASMGHKMAPGHLENISNAIKHPPMPAQPAAQVPGHPQARPAQPVKKDEPTAVAPAGGMPSEPSSMVKGADGDGQVSEGAARADDGAMASSEKKMKKDMIPTGPGGSKKIKGHAAGNDFALLAAEKKPSLHRLLPKKAETLEKPYVSQAQQGFFHSPAAARAGITQADVKHWDEASKGHKNLPEHVRKDGSGIVAMSDDKRSFNKSDFDEYRNPGKPKLKEGHEECQNCEGHGKIFNNNDPKSGQYHICPKCKGQGSKLGKAQMPGGAGMPKAPTPAQMPKPPVPASNNPAAAAQKQAQQSAKGKVAMPHTPGAPKIKNPAAAPAGPSLKQEYEGRSPMAQAQKEPSGAKELAATKDGSKTLQSNRLAMYRVTKSEVYAKCIHCGTPEFSEGPDGQPKFQPCACFSVVRKDENDKPQKFVDITKNQDGTFKLTFSPDADPDTVKAFLLTLKAKLLLQRKFGI